MLLLRNLAVSVLSKIKRANLCKKRTVTHLHQFRNLILYTPKCPIIRCVDRRFCTNFQGISKENLSEDVMEDEKPVSQAYVVEPTTEEMFEEIAAGDPAILKNLKLLEFEIAVLREEEFRVPDQLKKCHWEELLEMKTVSKRKKYLAFLRLNELKTQSGNMKAENKREFFLKRKEELGFHYYGLSGHTMFLRVYDKDLNRILNLRSLKSNLDIIFDCSYQEYMSKLNIKACAKQIFYCYTESRLHRYPCHLKLFNLDRNDALGQILPKFLQGVYDQYNDDIHMESYLNFYPREKLVYLTPHANASLKTFNPDDIYIIGAFVDKGTGVKASLAKAKQNNLRMFKFPIDEYLRWKQGSKSLPLNVVLNVLLDMAFYDDWNMAFKNLPSRCFKGD